MNTVNDSFLQAGHDIDFDRRFGGVARLYGAPALQRFRAARVCVIGVGGVGSWIVEGLARNAVGHLTLIDLDHVAESNVNRQIQALTDTLGMAKVGALAGRIALINPYCEVVQVEEFIEAGNLETLVGAGRYDYVVDAIDSAQAKAALIAYCRERAIPLVTIGSAGGQTDPAKIQVRDLARTEQEPLLKKVRRRLRSQYGFPRGEKHKFHIDAVFSMETLRMPESPEACDLGDGAGVTGLNCAGFGSSVVVTATFGMMAAAHVLNRLAAQAVAAPAQTEAAQAA